MIIIFIAPTAAYDPGHQLCCGDWIDTVVLERRSHQTSCCGQTTYEEGIESCCPRTSQVFLGADRHCCMIEVGQELAYDPNSGICCSSFFHGNVLKENKNSLKCDTKWNLDYTGLLLFGYEIILKHQAHSQKLWGGGRGLGVAAQHFKEGYQ